jgi:hypothetical protein
MTAFGATTTSSLIAGKVCFQEAAKRTSTAEMRRIAAIRNADNEGRRWVNSRSN